MSITFCVPYRNVNAAHPHGNFETPAAAMSRGIGVYTDGSTVVECTAGSIPYGFLNTEVTTDGPSYEERLFIPLDSIIFNEVKVSTHKVQVFPYVPGVSYILKGNILSGTTLGQDEYVFMADDGEFCDLAAASAGHHYLGVVEETGVTFMSESNCIVWKAMANLGIVPA